MEKEAAQEGGGGKGQRGREGKGEGKRKKAMEKAKRTKHDKVGTGIVRER